MRKVFNFTTKNGQVKELEMLCGDLAELDLKADMVVCSAFKNNYMPSRSSLIGTLQHNYGISVAQLAEKPAMNLKDLGIWISESIEVANTPFKRLACVEMIDREEKLQTLFETVFFAVFKGIRNGYRTETIALPLIGTGNQEIGKNEIFVPLIAECLNAFDYIDELKKITFFEKDIEKYRYMCDYIQGMLDKNESKTFFISYSHKDFEVANKIADELEKKGVKVWIDHKKIRNPEYSQEIVKALKSSSAFLILVSSNSQSSVDVRRELFNAGEFERTNNLLLFPIRLDEQEYIDSFGYYLAGHNHADLRTVTWEKIQEVCDKICEEINKTTA